MPETHYQSKFYYKKNKNMKKVIFRILPAVILLVAAIAVLGGCEKSKLKLKGTTWKLNGIYDVDTK